MKTLKYLVLLFILCSCHVAKVQQIDYKALDDLTPKYKFNALINYYFERTQDGGTAATDYSFVSEHQKLIQALRSTDTIDRISEKMLNQIQQKYRPQNAHEYIIAEAEKHEIIMLNENHAIPQHRNFLSQLLPELAKLGYNNLGLEGLNNDSFYEQEIETMGYPKTYHGYYLREPEYANLIRSAHRLGYKVFGYNGEGEDGSARNILDKRSAFEKKGKTIILCGWDHIKEGPTGTYWEYAIAGRIKEFSGIDPLTINQAQYFERAERVYEDSLYQALDFDGPTVLIDDNNESIDLEKDPGWYDLFVFHPRTEFKEGVPAWILRDKQMKEFSIPKLEINCPCKVMLYEKGDEVEVAVPTYIVEIATLQKEVRLPVRKEVAYKLLIGNNEVAYLVE